MAKEKSYIQLGLNVSNFVESYRNIGYTMKTALADIIDNSIYAKATEIHVNMIWDDFVSDQPVIQVLDNGFGMSNDELIRAMQLACRSPLEQRESSDLGRYGLGLKSASFSQCRIVTVCSKKDGVISAKQWDLNHVQEVERFEIADVDPDDFDAEELLPWNSGTAVIWNQIDQLDDYSDMSISKREAAWDRAMSVVREHIALIYSSFQGQINFFFNGNPVELWDPFLLGDDNGPNICVDEDIPLGDGKVHITTYILPNKLTPEQTRKLSFDKSLSEYQGFYVYRNNRLIVPGSWLNLPKMTVKEAYRLAHIRIDIDNTMDSLWHIDIKKENAVCPPALVNTLLSYAKQARKESSKIFRSKGKTLRRHQNLSERTFLWTYGIREDKPFYSINRKNPVIENFCNSLDTDQKKEFNGILKFIENYIPVMSIVEQESNSDGKYVENNASVISDKEILMQLEATVDGLIGSGLSRCDALRICKEIEPFVSYPELISVFEEND